MARPRRSSFAGSDVVLPSAATEAYAHVEPLLAELPESALVSADADSQRAISVVLGALPKLRELRSQIAEQLPKFPIEKLDNLEKYALAAWYAHLLSTTPRDASDAKALTQEGETLREDLLVAAEALAYRAYLDKEKVAAIRKGKSDLATALVELAALYRESWEKIRAKTTVEEREVDRAAELAPQLLAVNATQGQNGKGKPDDIADRRIRALSLLVRTFDELRRAVTYVRWKEKDVDSYLPVLIKSTRGRKPGKGASAAAEANADDAMAIEDDGAATDAEDVPGV